MSDRPVSLPITTLLTIGGLLVGATLSHATKASKGELDDLKKEVVEIREKAREESVIQKNILSLLDRIDKRMERVEDKQDYMIREQYKRWNGDASATPSPNPLNR